MPFVPAAQKNFGEGCPAGREFSPPDRKKTFLTGRGEDFADKAKEVK